MAMSEYRKKNVFAKIFFPRRVPSLPGLPDSSRKVKSCVKPFRPPTPQGREDQTPKGPQAGGSLLVAESHASQRDCKPDFVGRLEVPPPRGAASRRELLGGGKPRLPEGLQVEGTCGVAGSRQSHASQSFAAMISAIPNTKLANMTKSSLPVPLGASRNSRQMKTPQMAATSVAPCPSP